VRPHSALGYLTPEEFAKSWAATAVEKTRAGPAWKTLRVSHFPTASTAARRWLRRLY